MKVTIDNLTELQSGMKKLQRDWGDGKLDSFRPTVFGALQAFGYWREYHVGENDLPRRLSRQLDNVLVLWETIEEDVGKWLEMQDDTRDYWVNQWIAECRARFEPKLNDLERHTRMLAELCGDSVDKAGN